MSDSAIYICIPRSTGYPPRLTEHLPDETAATAVGFLARALAWFATHGLTQTSRVVTDNGSCYRPKALTQTTSHAARHQLIRPYTATHNRKVERDQPRPVRRAALRPPFTSEAQRAQAIKV